MHRPISEEQTRRPNLRLAPRSAAAPADRPSGRAELRAVIDAMPEAVVVLDGSDSVRLTNQAADRLFLGRPPKDRTELLARFQEVPGASAPSESVTLRPRHLPSRWYELRSVAIERPQDAAEGVEAPTNGPAVGETADAAGAEGDDAPDGAPEGRIVILRDVTRTREEREERNAFLSILSHELRTPITTIYAGSRVLARRPNGNHQASQEIAADISAEAAHLYDVVEDLLVLARAERGVLELAEEPVHLQRVAESAIRIVAGRTPELRILFDGATDPPAVRGDAVYVEQVVRNMLTAAIRGSRPTSPITIRLEAGANEVALTVLDRGAALTDLELESMFTLTEDRTDLRRSGAGIGPFVCRRLVEAMHGRIWVRRHEDSGAAWGFALPRYTVD
ncbi:MAG TPA: ATP-binding protein [Candidatus Limnocylindrales bacterium]|nr:ATP-binding protein [Candidatus Limnocylindrales bacterium]